MLPLSSSRDLRSAMRRSIDAIFWVVVIINSFDLLFGRGGGIRTHTSRTLVPKTSAAAFTPHPVVSLRPAPFQVPQRELTVESGVEQWT